MDTTLELRVGHLEDDVKEIRADIGTLKKDVHALQTDVAVIKSNYATKSDVSDLKSSLIQWMVGIFLAAIAVNSGVVVWALNKALPAPQTQSATPHKP